MDSIFQKYGHFKKVLSIDWLVYENNLIDLIENP